MCDTFCILGGWSDSGETYFAKNSDRSPNEPHLVLRVPGANHAADSIVQCTYISVPQAKTTLETILYKPSWIWGAEMGVNEARVAIGNEAVFTKAKRGEPALTGMDILRLALERADTAASAIETMIDLLGRYGQGGNCGYDKEFHYDNSFLAADPKEAYVLETSGKKYAAMKVEDRYAISNRLTIGDFAKKNTEPVYSHFSAAKKRRKQVMERLAPQTGAAELMGILRTHEAKIDGCEFRRGSVGSVCMHAGGAIGDHTTGSLVAVLRRTGPVTLWSTGSSTPCISAFKPVFRDFAAPPLFEDPAPALEYWMKREHIHRAVIAGKIDANVLRERIRGLEAEWLKREKRIMGEEVPCAAELMSLSADADRQEQEMINSLYVEDWGDTQGSARRSRYWDRKNERLGAGSAF